MVEGNIWGKESGKSKRSKNVSRMGSETLEDRRMGFIGRITRKIRASESAVAAEANLREHKSMAGCAILDDRPPGRAEQCNRFHLDSHTR